MSARFPRLGVIVVGALALLATSAPPASATTIKVATFVGTFTLLNCPGLGHPVNQPLDPNPILKTGPKNEPQMNIAQQGNRCNFILGSTGCVKTSIGKKAGAADVCLLSVTGTIWGFCGFFTGVGALTLINAAGTKNTLAYAVKLTGRGGRIFFSGGNKESNVYGDVNTIPTTGSCTDKTATGWGAAGTFVFKTCTGGTISGVCAVP